MDPETADILLPYLLAVAAALALLALGLVLWHRGRRTSWLQDAGERGELGSDIGRLRRELVEVGRRADQQLQVRLGELRGLLVEADQRIAQLRRQAEVPGHPRPGQAEPPGRSAKHEAVLKLHRQGMSSEEIAAGADLDVGQVELILNLERLATKAGDSPR